MDSIGKSIMRKEAQDKAEGRLRYLNDYNSPDILYGALKTSSYAHAKIKSIDKSEALKMPGVRAVLTGEDLPYRFGIYLGDKPPLAVDKVRYYGEAVAAVVADSQEEADAAAEAIKVEYEALDVISFPGEALKDGAILIHEDMKSYSHIDAIRPEPGTNVANRTKIRKGNIEEGFEKSFVIIDETFSFPPSDHVAMETRAAMAEILGDGRVVIHSTTQAPFVVKNLMAIYFGLDPGKVTVITHPIGGGYGGKAGMQLEGLVYLLSKAVGGRKVKLVNTREQDLVTSPGHIGLEASVKLGAAKDGELMAAELLYMFDSGAYADYAVNISRAAAIACTGPYRIPNVWCDSLCVYTNHPFATAYRGFGHIELAFAIERAMDMLADKLNMDPMELRLKNAIKRGDTSPTRSIMDDNTGDLAACIKRTAEMVEWDKGSRIVTEDGKIRAKGFGCLWKAPAMPTNTDAGAIITFNEDGSINVHCGVVEIGQGIKTALAQIAAERMGMKPDMVHVIMDVNTSISPHDWATAASRGLMMAGRAVISACEDAISQIKHTASQVLRCPEEDLDVSDGRVFVKDDKHIGLLIKDVALGYVYPNGNAVGGQIIGRGRYISRRLTGIDPETGEGNPALEWTLGAEAVEIELDPEDCSYKVLKAVCTMDVGKVVNPAMARGQIMGAMAMALSYAKQEGFQFNKREQVVNNDLRSYKTLRFTDRPQYLVDYIETPQGDGPYGARGLGEQGVIGIPGALANALSRAIGKPLNQLPLTPESIWRVKEGI